MSSTFLYSLFNCVHSRHSLSPIIYKKIHKYIQYDYTPRRACSIVVILYSFFPYTIASFCILKVFGSIRMDEKLKEVAQFGDVDALYALINENPFVLEHFDGAPFAETPLHLAAATENIPVALEIMRLKPLFAQKPNRDGFSPMHVALQQEQLEMVLALLDADANLVRVKGREGKTPLHLAAEKGATEVLVEFLAACPQSIRDRTIRKETALHVAAKNCEPGALKVLLGWIDRVGSKKLLKLEDDQGHNVLQVVESVICQKQLHNSDWKEIRNMLRCTRAFMCPPFQGRPERAALAECLMKKTSIIEKWVIAFHCAKYLLPNDHIEAILVVAVLIATATYQAAISPPGGVWQADPYSLLEPKNFTQMSITRINPQNLCGTSVLNDGEWTGFCVLNTISFSASIITIEKLLPLHSYVSWLLVMPLAACYALSVGYISPFDYYSPAIIFSCCYLIAHLDIFLLYLNPKKFRAINRLYGEHMSKFDQDLAAA